jgi:hypothetical protein
MDLPHEFHHALHDWIYRIPIRCERYFQLQARFSGFKIVDLGIVGHVLLSCPVLTRSGILQ